MRSLTLPNFWQLYGQLPIAIRRRAQAAYRNFQKNPQHPGLHFHRLFHDGRFWSVRITRDYRAVGILENDTITWIWIGDHAAFDRAFQVSQVGTPSGHGVPGRLFAVRWRSRL